VAGGRPSSRWDGAPKGESGVGEGVPKRGIGSAGNIVSAPFAREKPLPVRWPPLPEKSGEWGRAGVASGPFRPVGGQSVGVGEACFWPLPVRRPPLSPGEGRERPCGQRLHLAQSVLGPLGGQSGEGAGGLP
jgi:hypothetical protein